jgi:hypothetical protein
MIQEDLMKSRILVFIIISLSLILASCTQEKEIVPVPGDDLLGKWSLMADLPDSFGEGNLILVLNEINADPEIENRFLGTGCMQTISSGEWAPLSMQADYDEESGSYDWNGLSTLIPDTSENEAAVIHFIGNAMMASRRGDNDTVSGNSYSSLGEISWEGIHASTETAGCPETISERLFLDGSVGVRRDLATTQPTDIANFLTETNIVSSKLMIEAPNGEKIVADYQTDIFNPNVDFISQFRYHFANEGTPEMNTLYKFSLLDQNGKAIPGADFIDAFRNCDHGAAANYQFTFDPGQFFELTWESPKIISGSFDPENGHGFFQITIEKYPQQEGGFVYGAEGYKNTHRIPWITFVPGSPGAPDGFDYGISLSEFENGEYEISIFSYNRYDPPEGENGHDCWVFDSRENIVFLKEGDQLTLITGEVE